MIILFNESIYRIANLQAYKYAIARTQYCAFNLVVHRCNADKANRIILIIMINLVKKST